MAAFVDHGSIVRRIWGDADLVLLVFAGSAAEFALNRAVDWLFFTGALPRDPIGRLFSTAAHAQGIVFADEPTAARTLGRIRDVHQAVERARGQAIPAWAHRDVLYMLIDYSERAHELLVRPLSPDERRDLYSVFRRVGTGLAIPDLPPTYDDWRADRVRHLHRDLLRSAATDALFARYRAHLGPFRYRLLVQQSGRPAHDFAGTVALTINLQHDGRAAVLNLPDPALPSAGPAPLAFRHYQRVEGTFAVPEGATVVSVLVRIESGGQTRAQQTFTM